MDDAGLEAGGGQGAAWGVVVAAGAFDGDEEVVEAVVAQGLANLAEGGVEGGAVVSDGGGRGEDVAVEDGEPPLGAGLGPTHGADAEVFGSDLLNARVEGAAGLRNGVGASGAGALAGAGTGHG